MIDIILWELKRRKSSIIWWSLGSVILIATILFIYPSIRDQAAQFNKVINELPEGLRGLKTGGVSNTLDVADPISYLNSQLFYATLPILWIILTITRSGAVLGKEEQTHTIELLLARPISRSKLLASKALAVLLESAIVTIVSFVGVFVFAQAVDLQVASWPLLETTVLTMLFCLSFGAIAFALQAASTLTRRMAITTAVFVGFGGYILASLSGLTDWLKGPAKIAPYHYFAPDKILHGDISAGFTVYLVAVFVLAAFMSWFGFRKRDVS